MYFNERFNEKKEDPSKDKITFALPCFITPQLDENTVTAGITLSSEFWTKYKFYSAKWFLSLKRNRCTISMQADDDDEEIRAWNGTCFCSYNLYSDNEKRLLFYSSERIEMRNSQNSDTFNSPAGFLTKYDEAITENKLKKMVLFIELQLPVKYFYRPFEMPSSILCKKLCDEYPTDLEKDFRFDFLKDSDFVIKCPDGEMPAMRIVLNNASEYMHEHFNTFPNSKELAVEHSIDVVKPIIISFHTRCFEMPKLYDLDYATRLLMAIYFFNPDVGYGIKRSVHESLCQKFVKEKHNFISILQWIKIAYQQRLRKLKKMIATVIADKFYFKWHLLENARDEETPLFCDIFGQDSSWALQFFNEIEDIFCYSLLINVILD